MSVEEYSLGFDGDLLKRGFWLHTWAIGYNGQQYIYINQTGDGSWPNAPSPITGLSQHFDTSKHAPKNSLTSCLHSAGIDPQGCYFRMIALGPIFEEQLTVHKHEPLRDQMDTLAFEIAAYLKWRGFEVLGSYQKRAAVKEQLLDEIKSKIIAFVTE